MGLMPSGRSNPSHAQSFSLLSVFGICAHTDTVASIAMDSVVNLLMSINVDFRFRYYRVEDGLSSNTVFKIIQDKDGLMWFGTNDGLSRYDGTIVKTWRNVPEDTLSIGNNTVFALGEDETGTIYAGTENGLWAFDKRRENFRCLLPSVQVRCLDVDTFGLGWLSTLGQRLFRVKAGEVRH